jgi:hypothetical protein
METAINELKIKLEMFEHNEPIQRVEGRTEDADRSAKGAAEVREALKFLERKQSCTTIPNTFRFGRRISTGK